MTVVRRWAALLLAVLAVGVALPGSASAAPARTDPSAADRVVVVGVPGLTWSDIGPDTTPQLTDLAGSSSIGAVSVRAARSTSCLLDGWATLGAGNRARFPGRADFPAVFQPGKVDAGTGDGPGDAAGGSSDAAAPTGTDDAGNTRIVDAALSHCGLQEQVADIGLVDPTETVGLIAQDRSTRRFGSQAAALGTAVGCAGVIGRAATIAVAARGVDVTTTTALPQDPAAIGPLLTGCPLTLLSLDQLTAGRTGVHQTNTGKTPDVRATALAGIDDAVGRVRRAIAALPGRTLLVVAGISEVNDSRPHLHVGIVSGPGFDGAGWLSSASTGRAPYTELIDVAPTALQALGKDVPASMNGQPMRRTGDRPALAEAVAQLDRADVAASVHYRSTADFFWTLLLTNAGLVLAGMLALGGLPMVRGLRWPGVRGLGPSWRRLVRAAALPVAALPVASYLATLVPWPAAAQPRWALLASVAGADLVVTAAAALGPWRRRRLGPPVAVLAITLGTVVLDVVTGSHLELNGVLGYDAIVAGRFVGSGNMTFALLGSSALLLTAGAATAAGRRWRPERPERVVAAVTLGLGVVVLALDGAPELGRDFGGVLAAVPAFLLLAMLLTGVRVSVTRVVAILGVAVLVVGTVAFVDWLRPPDARTHLGRFVQQLLTGEAWTVVSRKASANLHILTSSPLAWMLPVVAVAMFWLVRTGGLLRHRGGGATGLPARTTAVLRAGLLATALCMAIGSAVNDSGVAIAATAAALLLPLLIWLAAAPRAAGPDDPPTGDDPRCGPAEGPDRVTVGSRGSTVWNA